MVGLLPLILASGSPRRQLLLEQLNINFVVCAADSDGPVVSDNPETRVAGHALFKAQQVAANNPQRCVLAGDTLVYGDGEFFGKPADRRQARQMLLRLQEIGEHRVYTATCLLSDQLQVFQVVNYAVVRFSEVPQPELDLYLTGTEWCDKAGAYAIQGWAGQYASCVSGDFDNIVGMSPIDVKKLFAESGFQY